VDEDKKKEYNAIFGFIKSQLESKIKEVKPSTRLQDSVACLSGDSYDMSAYMEKILKSSGQPTPESKRVLELNMDHAVMHKIKALYEEDRKNETLKDYSKLLYDLAVIGEGGKVENPARFSKLVGELMAGALD
jgi:molecular chaperone HtpG